jgi:hypothetical protein
MADAVLREMGITDARVEVVVTDENARVGTGAKERLVGGIKPKQLQT